MQKLRTILWHETPINSMQNRLCIPALECLARLHKLTKEITATTTAAAGGKWKLETLLRLIAVVRQWVLTAILPKNFLYI